MIFHLHARIFNNKLSFLKKGQKKFSPVLIHVIFYDVKSVTERCQLLKYTYISGKFIKAPKYVPILFIKWVCIWIHTYS